MSEKIRRELVSKAMTAANYKRWREQRGIRLVMTILPYKKSEHRAICEFEGNTYVGVGKNNIEALNNCFKALNPTLGDN